MRSVVDWGGEGVGVAEAGGAGLIGVRRDRLPAGVDLGPVGVHLTATLDGLSAVLPHARRVTLRGLGHTAADNGGKPDLVAAQLREFFT